MIRAEYGCATVLMLSPIPFGSFFAAFGEPEITNSEKAAIFVLDAAKMALFVWGVIDVLSNGATNFGRIAIPYIACAAGALVSPMIVTWHNPDFLK